MGQVPSTQHLPGPSPGQKYRDLANKEGDARRELSQQSQDAYKRNSGARAKELSDKAKTHYAKMERYNALAATEIFAAHNPSYLTPSYLGILRSFFAPPVTLAKIDLHGLLVDEALEKVRVHLDLCRWYGVGRTKVITGKGLHSVDGIAKIRPRVQELLEEKGMVVVTERRVNDGAFVVEVGKGPTGLVWLWEGLFGST